MPASSTSEDLNLEFCYIDANFTNTTGGGSTGSREDTQSNRQSDSKSESLNISETSAPEDEVRPEDEI